MDITTVMKLTPLEFRTLGSPHRSSSSNSNSRSNSALRNSLSTPRVAPIIGVKPGTTTTTTTTTTYNNNNNNTASIRGTIVTH